MVVCFNLANVFLDTTTCQYQHTYDTFDARELLTLTLPWPFWEMRLFSPKSFSWVPGKSEISVFIMIHSTRDLGTMECINIYGMLSLAA